MITRKHPVMFSAHNLPKKKKKRTKEKRHNMTTEIILMDR